MLLENIDGRPPTLLQTYNPLWYADALKLAGFELAFTFSTYGVDVEQYRARRKASHSEKVLPGSQFSVRSATRTDLRSNLEEIRCLFNSAFAENYEVAPISKASFKFQIDSVKTFIDLEGIKLIELDGRAFEAALVNQDRVLGSAYAGLAVASDTMAFGRLGIAATCVGGLWRCVQLMIRYSTPT